MKQLIFILLMGWLWTSCSDDSFHAGDKGYGEDEVPVRLTITTPAAALFTRSGNLFRQTDHESAIHEIQVLVFENGEYKYRVPGIAIHNNGTSTTFDARLISSSQPLKLCIVANATAAITGNEPQAGDSETEVKKKIKQTFTMSGVHSGFPMFADYTLHSGLNAGQVNNITGIKALRAIARIDVKAGELNNFRLTSVRAYRANSQIQVMHEGSGLVMTSPYVPETSSTIIHTSPITVEGYESVAQLYLPESVTVPETDRRTKATCIVVGGVYENDTEPTYYRMDFDPKDENRAFGQVLRNHKYIFNIRSVSGSGWQDPDDAALNVSAHIEVEVKAWDDHTQDMYFDGAHHFGVSAREIRLGNKANSARTIFVNTDISDYTLQWSDAQGNAEGGASASLVNESFTVQKNADGSQLIVTALQDNSAAASDKMAYFIVTANRWQVLITVCQRNGAVATRLVNVMTFNGGLGDMGSNILPPLNSGNTRSDGLRGILTNKGNFGPSGRVECGGINLLFPNPSKNKLSDELFATADIIYVNYMASTLFGEQDALKLHNWLKTSRNRVLIVSFDGYDVSVPLMTEILGTTAHLIWLRTNTGPYSLTGKAENNFFTDAGPFTTAPYAAVSDGFEFRNYDAYHGEVGGGSAVGITPILTGPGGGIVLGIDSSRRIIYWGDVDLGNTSSGTAATMDNRIVNTTGDVNNNASRLIANVWAWAVQVVLDE